MSTIQLPSGRYVQLKEDMTGKSPQEIAGAVYSKIREIPDFQEDASQLAQKYEITTSGVGQTFGGTVGAAGGAAAGAALGTLGGPFAPLTVPLGAIAGGFLLGGAGGAAGEAIEAEVRGVEGDPLAAAAEEAKYGLIPGVGGAAVKGATRGAGLLAKGKLDAVTLGFANRIPALADVHQKLGKVGSRLTQKGYDQARQKADKEFLTRFLKTPEGKKVAEGAGFKVDAKSADRLLKGSDREAFFKEALKVSPAELKKHEAKVYDNIVAELIRNGSIKKSQATAAVSLLVRGESLDSLDGEAKLPGEGGRGLL